jgi:glycine cleavage system H protein
MTEGNADLRYSPDHLWLSRDGERVTIGVTERVSRSLTWVHSVALPRPGDRLAAGDALAEIDSQKADIEVPAPAALEIVAVNEALGSDPMLVRMDPRGDGWLATAKLEPGAWEHLLPPDAYAQQLRAEDAPEST